jgi:uncharacterized membrane protein YoaT (DUF817 family)
VASTEQAALRGSANQANWPVTLQFATLSVVIHMYIYIFTNTYMHDFQRLLLLHNCMHVPNMRRTATRKGRQPLEM